MHDPRPRLTPALALAGALCGLALGGDVLLAQGSAPAAPDRYTVTRLDLDGDGEGRLEVLDRTSGRLFVLVVGGGEEAAVALDPVRGELVTREVRRSVDEPREEAGPPTWPSADAAGGGRPFRPVEGPGGRPAVFDGTSGRLYVVAGDREVRIYDPVQGAVTRRLLRVADGADVLAAPPRESDEDAAVASLRAIAEAQAAFREEDAEGDGAFDYGTLAELAAADLIDEELASGTRRGYAFAAQPAAERPEFLWMATATPRGPDAAGRRSFATNQAGVVYYTVEQPFEITPDCQIPAGAEPVD